MTDAFDPESLWNKSKVFVDKACVCRDADDEWGFHLWSALALELLGKAALAHINPALVADPTDFKSLLMACGVTVTTTAQVRSVTAKTVFERLKTTCKDFDTARADECMTMMNRRNAELHSGEFPVAGLNQEAWVPVFWRNASLLVSTQGRDLADWLGNDEAERAQAIISDSAETQRQTVLARIARRSAEFQAKCPSGSVEFLDAQKRAQVRPSPLADEDCAYEKVECPSCGLDAWLLGEEWSREINEQVEEVSDEDSYGGYYDLVTITYGGESLECSECGLRLEGNDEIEIAELPPEFEVEVEEEPVYEMEYGNE